MNRKLIFKKMQGIGNDFVLIDSKENPSLFNNHQLNLKPSEISKIANRNYGVGCDQLLVIAPSSNKLAHFDYLIFNQDGSSASYCGNGARCVIRYLIDKYEINHPIKLNTHGRITTGYLNEKGHITINMGHPDFNPQACGYIKEFNQYNDYSHLVGHQIINFGIVSLGNPHAIIRLEHVTQLEDNEYLGETAQAIQQAALFTHGVNVSFFIVNSEDEITMRTYERGVGFTLACGSGACATASFAISRELCNKAVIVNMPGGSLLINWEQGKEIIMSGDAKYVFEGIILL